MSNATMHAPGASIRCTITKVPGAKAKKDTIARLMRQDPANAKSLRISQKTRETKNNFYIRGNRIWGARAKCSKIVRVAEGQTWNMTFTPQLGPDLASVSEYLNIETA
ncbi:MAG TPA: hypothetical protein ENJ00_08670 [Phycisphaerales bacterium]|nr:hypothetical protein [Phycisphaerales bacterium]